MLQRTVLQKLRELRETLSFMLRHPLNKRRRTHALWRFVSWQIGSRLVPGPVVIEFVDGSKLLVAPGMSGATGAIYNGLHEYEDMAFVLHCLREDDLFVDVGSNVGSYTVLAAAVIHASCISFEPVPTTFQSLLMNIRLNGIGERVEALNVGIASASGFLRFTSRYDILNHVIVDLANTDETVEVKVTTLDECLRDRHPTIVKIDVEGFEAEVIEGAKLSFASEKLLAVIVEINKASHNYGRSEEEIESAMASHGFRPFAYSPIERRLTPLEHLNRRSNNTLYLKNAELVGRRVEAARQFDVRGRRI